jgi:Trehalose utilisation
VVNSLRGALVALAMSVFAMVLASDTVGGQQQPAPDPPMLAVLKNYRPVTAERLKSPSDEDWLMIRRTYDGWGFSPLSDVTPANVQRLRPAWVFSTGEARVHQAAPLGIGGSRPFIRPGATHVGEVQAWNVDTGQKVWTHIYDKSPNWGGMRRGDDILGSHNCGDCIRAAESAAGPEQSELYANLRWQPEGSVHVLATAYDDHALYNSKARQPIPGAGIRQPILWTTEYGTGRVFVTTLGHSPSEVKQVGFGTTFARGAEWAATGKVTLPIPPELAR